MRKIKEPRGIIKNRTINQKFTLNRRSPPAKLDYIIEHYWSIQWHLDNGEKVAQNVLSHPNIHITNENSFSRVHGVVTKRFERIIEGSGYVLAIKFKPASFTYLTKLQISNLTNKTLPLLKVTNKKFYEIFHRPMDYSGEEERFNEISNFLLSLKHEPNSIIQRLNAIVKKIEEDNSITNVSHLEKLMKMNIRGIQRIFKEYIGVSPKWVINRYRLHEAMAKIESFKDDDILTELTYELGYFDQAHFIKDFKNLIGRTPGEYRKEIQKMNLA